MGKQLSMRRRLQRGLCALALALAVVNTPLIAASALGSSQNPQTGSVGLEGKVNAPAPTQAATIATPGNGQTVTTMPITVSGLCKTGLLVKVFSNNIFMGADQCTGGSYSMQVTLFSGQNNLVARVYDTLDQSGPDSNAVVVTFNDAEFVEFGTKVSVTSQYAQLGAAPGDVLTWPLTISGGVGPYAVSVDWGDGTSPELQSISFAGEFNAKHTYRSSGIYKVIVRVTDHNGTTAFLQLVGVATGKVTQGTSNSNGTTTSVTGSGGSAGSSGGTSGSTTAVSPWVFVPVATLFPLIGSTFWLGRRHELFVLRKRLEKTRSEAKL